MIETIPDFHLTSNGVATSGQPTPEQFAFIAESGYQIVVNLATSSSDNALANEGEIVSNLGMVYVHIPVLWNNPQLKDVQRFFRVMQAFKSEKIWVHCAKNMRVSCFIYLWQKYMLQLSEEQARYPMNQIWQPKGVWQQLINESETTLADY